MDFFARLLLLCGGALRFAELSSGASAPLGYRLATEPHRGGRFASLRLCRGLLWRMVLAELYIINVKMGKMVKSAIFLKKKWEIFCGMKKCS